MTNDTTRNAIRPLLTVFVLGLFALMAGQAHAQSSRLCRQLEAQLADTGRGGGGASSAQVRRYDRAIADQRRQIQKARSQLRRSNCSNFDVFGRGGGSCSGMNAQLDRMERNLASLERRRADMSTGGGGNSRRERARIMAAIDANGCRDVRRRDDQGQRVARRDGGPSFLERLFGGNRSYERYEPRSSEPERVRSAPGTSFEEYGGGGSFRTLCVRTCDGYYWPISYSSTRSEFERDEQNCQTMCPGTEVQLYSHRVPDEESEQMVDSGGNPYTDLSSAFKYKDVNFQRPEACSCGSTKKNFTVIAGSGQGLKEIGAEAAPVTLPMPRPDPAADPETAANRDGGLNPDVVKRLVDTGPGSTGADRKVRVVGPAYLPDPPVAEDRRVPAQTSVQ